jgi:hypothetical protein
MNIYYENPRFFDNLPNELLNHICKFLPIRPFLEEFKKIFGFMELLQVSMYDLLCLIRRLKNHCSKKGVNYKKCDEKTMMEFVKIDYVYLVQDLNLNGAKFLRFQEAYIKQYGVPTIPEGWV